MFELSVSRFNNYQIPVAYEKRFTFVRFRKDNKKQFQNVESTIDILRNKSNY